MNTFFMCIPEDKTKISEKYQEAVLNSTEDVPKWDTHTTPVLCRRKLPDPGEVHT